MNAPVIRIQDIDRATEFAIAAGHRVLATHLYGETEVEHVDFLSNEIAAPAGAVIMDVGCGIGEMARLMAEADPSLQFQLVNLSMKQLGQCPAGEQFRHFLADFHILSPGLAPVCDVVMFHSALCQMDTGPALAQAWRFLKPGGTLFINDMARTEGEPEEMESSLGARVLTPEDLMLAVVDAGFEDVQASIPQYDASAFRRMLDLEGMGHLLEGVYPIIVKAAKPAASIH